jgi:transcriptional regulator with XRE-family HTH domain
VPRIALRLAELNLTVESFTADAGLDRRTVQRLLSGKTQNPQYSTVKAMADFLALQPRDILLIAGADTATDSSTPRARPDVEMHLPVTGAYLVDRAQEMERLDRVWSGGQTNILSIVAWGGVGKSTLVNHWVGRLAQDGWRGAERVFGWTFSSQGTQDPAASADSFIEAALRYCGDPEPSLGTPRDKGQRLARFVGAKRTLLVLDGLEPLQSPPVLRQGR